MKKSPRNILFLFLLLNIHAWGNENDTLLVTRPAILHQASNSQSATLEHLVAGDLLSLLGSEPVDNYFHVVHIGSNKKGWVHKNYVRAHSSTMSNADTSATVSSNNNAAELDSVSVRIVDVGAGLCTLIRLPGNKYIIYDAGGLNTSDGSQTTRQMSAFIDSGSTIEMMVLSHADGDHIVAAEQAIRHYHIKKLIWGGYDRKIDGSNANETDAFERLKQALYDRRNITESVNLHERDSTIYPGGIIRIDNATIKLLCGFGKPLPEWHLTNSAERLNGVSIVMKLVYGGNSVLFTGDAVGRRKNDPETACIATEKFLVDNAGDELQSTVMLSPHHGAENGSSRPFLEKVKPGYIVISAGHVTTFKHPRAVTGNRYLDFVPKENIFRTDRGDDEGPLEWNYQRIANCKDGIGDDDIQIDLRSDHKLHIYYLDPHNGCAVH